MTAIRLAEGRDLDALQRIFAAASMSNDGDRPALLEHPEVLQFSGESVREGRTRVAVRPDGQVMGFATFALGDSVMEVDDLFVDPDAMRQGAARALMADLVDIARASGMACLEVTGNEHAAAFYAAVGFVKIGMAQTAFALAPRLRLTV